MMSVRSVLLLLGLLAGITDGSSVKTFTYNHHVYEVHIDKKNQYDAEEQCNKADGNLAYFETEQEYDYVMKKLTQIGQDNRCPYFYIGLQQDSYDVNSFSRWVNGEKVRINHWASGEPNALLDWCVTTEIPDGKWYDVSCKTPAAFICRKRAKNVRKTCRVWGDPHYITFDGATIHFYGTKCKYLISKVCGSNAGQKFSVIAKNEFRNGNNAFSFTRYVEVHVSNHVITLEQQKRVKLNGLDVTDNLPVTNTPGFQVGYNGRYVYVTLDSEVRVLFDGNAELRVEAPSGSYGNKLCGMCGNFDGDTDNDYTLENGISVRHLQPNNRDYLIGQSWEVPDGEDGRCDKNPLPPTATPFCKEAFRHCPILIHPSGMFKDCLNDPRLDRLGLVKACVVDMCLGRTTICKQLTILAEMCSDLGYFNCWRQTYNCELECPENSHYVCSASTCPETCHSIRHVSKCLRSNVEGCQCDDGYVLDGEECVRRGHCGCHDESKGTNHKLDSTWIDEKCSYNMTCTADLNGGKNITKRPINCHEAAECKVDEGIQGCYCKPGYYGNGLTCDGLPETLPTQ